MKSVLISIQPKWCELIANGNKTVEVRKTKPKLETPFKVYIYCTKGNSLNYLKRPFFDNYQKFWVDNNAFGSNVARANGKVIGEFVCNNIDWHGLSNLIVKEDTEHTLNGTCLTKEEILNYLGYKKGTNIYACKNYDFYGWHISNLVIYDKPRELSEFMKECKLECDMRSLKVPPCEKCEHLIASFGCGRTITRPPQSWCYVESEVK